MTLYKLTRADGTTGDGDRRLQWGPGVNHDVGLALPPGGVIHAYQGPLQAVLMDPAHAKLGPAAVLWRCESEPDTTDGTKVGCRTLTTVETIALPELPTLVRVRCAIVLAQARCAEAQWTRWADAWLSGADRTLQAAAAAARAASLPTMLAWGERLEATIAQAIADEA